MFSLIFKICLFLPVATLVSGIGYSCRSTEHLKAGEARRHIFNPKFPLKEDCESSNCHWTFSTNSENDMLKLNCSVVDFSDNTLIRVHGKDDSSPVNYTEPFTATNSDISVATKIEDGCYNGRFHCTLDPPGGPSDDCMCNRNQMGYEYEFPSKASFVLNYEMCETCDDVMIIGSRLAITTAQALYGRDPQNYSLLAGNKDISELTMEEKEPLLTDVTAFIIHKNYVPGKLLNDFGMVVLAKDLIFSPTIQRACIKKTHLIDATLEEPVPKRFGVMALCPLVVLPPDVCEMRYNREETRFDKEQHLCVYTPEGKCGNHTSPIYHTEMTSGMTYGVGAITHTSYQCGIDKPQIAVKVAYFVKTMVQEIYPEAELCWDGTA